MLGAEEVKWIDWEEVVKPHVLSAERTQRSQLQPGRGGGETTSHCFRSPGTGRDEVKIHG